MKLKKISINIKTKTMNGLKKGKHKTMKKLHVAKSAISSYLKLKKSTTLQIKTKTMNSLKKKI